MSTSKRQSRIGKVYELLFCWPQVASRGTAFVSIVLIFIYFFGKLMSVSKGCLLTGREAYYPILSSLFFSTICQHFFLQFFHVIMMFFFQELHFMYFEHLFLMVQMTNALNGCRTWKAATMIMQLHSKATSPAFSHFFLLVSIFYSCLAASLLRVFLCLFRHSYLFLVLLLFSTCQQQNRKPCHANCLT